GGTGGINLSPNGSSNSGVLVKPTTADSTALFQVQSSSSSALFLVNSSGNGSAPASPGVAAGANTGGTLSGSASTTYYYKVSGILPGGVETPASSEVSINGQSFTKVTAPASAPTTVNAGAGS